MKFSEIGFREKARAERHIDRDPCGKLRPGPSVVAKGSLPERDVQGKSAQSPMSNNGTLGQTLSIPALWDAHEPMLGGGVQW
jgi:hypothetical protein